jgi:hypothetical protein
VLTLVTSELTLGERVDVLGNRVRTGWTLALSGRVRVTRNFEIEPSFNQGVLRSDGGGRAQTETAAQWLSVLHFSARDSLRLIVQRFSFVLTENAGPLLAPVRDKSTTGSLVYTHRRSASTVYYLGLTRAQRRLQLEAERSNSAELFAKVQFGI